MIAITIDQACGLNESIPNVVTSNGDPIGKLMLLRAHQFGRATAVQAICAPAPPVELARLTADLDATASQDLEPRA